MGTLRAEQKLDDVGPPAIEPTGRRVAPSGAHVPAPAEPWGPSILGSFDPRRCVLRRCAEPFGVPTAARSRLPRCVAPAAEPWVADRYFWQVLLFVVDILHERAVFVSSSASACNRKRRSNQRTATSRAAVVTASSARTNDMRHRAQPLT
eukprot:4444324-Prymnesium_polylepis.1